MSAGLVTRQISLLGRSRNDESINKEPRSWEKSWPTSLVVGRGSSSPFAPVFAASRRRLARQRLVRFSWAGSIFFAARCFARLKPAGSSVMHPTLAGGTRAKRNVFSFFRPFFVSSSR